MEQKRELVQRVQDLLVRLRTELHRLWSAAQLAARAGLSESHFRRACIHATGEPPMRHLKRVRLEAAAILLRTSRLSVKEVACRVGCPDVSHFVRDFRRAHGVTPSDFRRAATATMPPAFKEPSGGGSVLANE